MSYFNRRRHLIALGVLATWCKLSLSQGRSAAGGDILLGQSIDLSGPERSLGNDIVLGLNLYFNHLNLQGGINGRKVRLETLDDGYDLERASANVQKLLADPALLALLTPLGSTTTLRVAKEAGDVPVLFPLTGTEGIRGAATPNTYFLRATYGEEVRRIVDHSKQVGLTKLALIHSLDPFGKAGLAAFEKAMASAELQPHAIGTTLDFRSKEVAVAAQTVLKSKPDAVLVYLAGTFPDAAIALRRTGLRTPIYGISVGLTPENLKQLADHSRGLMFTQVVPPFGSPKFGVVREYLGLLRTTGQKASFGGMEGFLNAKVAAEALRRAGPNVDRTRLRSAMDALSGYDAGNFVVQFDPATRSGSKFVQIGVINAMGNLVN